MAGTSFTCPECGANARSARDIPAGALVKCPRCNHVFRLADRTGIAEAPPASPASTTRRDDEPVDVLPVAPADRRRNDDAVDDRPRRRPRDDDDDDRPRSRRRDDDDDDRPRSRRRDDDDDDRPRSRRRDDDDDDDRPRSRRRDDDDDDRPSRRSERKPKKKRSLVTSLVFLFVFGLMLVAVVGGVLAYAWKSGQQVTSSTAPVTPLPAGFGGPGFGPGGFTAVRGFGGDFNTTALHQPAEEAADDRASIFKDLASVFTDPPLAGERPRRLVGPPPAGAKTPVKGAGNDSSSALPPAILAKVKKATTMIIVNRNDGRSGSGSGFFVDQELVVTNAHVVGMLAPGTDKPKKVEVILNSGEADEAVCPALVLAVDRDHDLAVLKAGKPSKAVRFPDPLAVTGGGHLFETQPVFVFGFPLGEQLGRAITVSPSQVSSLRRDAAGVLDRVQVNGGMQPGNSGGPVVDAAGNVIGVSVAIIRDTAINFAVPGERVSGLMEGRLASLAIAEPSRQGGDYAVTVTVAAVDPLKRIKSASVDWWWGDAGQVVAAGRGAPPAPSAGVTRHTVALTVGNDGKSTAVLPLGQSLPEGKVLWLQARQRDASGGESYYQGQAVEIAPAAEARPVVLAYKPRRSPTRVAVRATNTVRLDLTEGGVHSMLVNVAGLMKENRLGLGQDGSWIFRLDFDKLDSNISLDDKPLDRSLSILDHAQHVGKSKIELQVGERGKVTAGRPSFSDVPEASQRILGGFTNELARAIELSSFAYPEGEIQPNQKWNDHRQAPFKLPEQEVQVGVSLHYTYQGIRRLNGREMAEVALTGEMDDSPDVQGAITGKVQGFILVDVKSGLVAKANLSLDATLPDMHLRNETAKANCFLEVKLQRE